MRSIPEIRTRLEEIAGVLADIAEEVSVLAEETKRRPSERVAGSSEPFTEEKALAIRLYKARNPEATQHEIAAIFNVNQGRVSVALRGARAEA